MLSWENYMRESRFDDLHRRLLREGVKPAWVKRTMDELNDHFNDLYKEAMADGLSSEEAEELARSRLGDPKTIVEEILARPELRSRAHRYPKTFFILAPLAIFVSVVTLLTLLIIGIGSMYRAGVTDGTPVPDWFKALADITIFFIKYVLGQVMTIMLFIQAYHRRVPWLWPLTGVVIMAITGSGIAADIVWPSGGNPGQYSLGLGIDTTRLLVTLGITGLFAYCYRYPG